MDLNTIFPEIKEAQSYSKHKDYTSALEVYTEVLQGVEENSEEYSYLLLEYAQCLLECVMYQSELNYKRILETRNPVQDDEVEEDLENAWECLETCRLYFEDLANKSKLSEVHKGLGDVLCLKNNFEEGKVEYNKALEFCSDEVASVEVLECIADCFRNMKLHEESIETYKKVATLCSKLGMVKKAEEYNGLAEGVELLKFKDIDTEGTEELDNVDDSVTPVDVNHLKRK